MVGLMMCEPAEMPIRMPRLANLRRSSSRPRRCSMARNSNVFPPSKRQASLCIAYSQRFLSKFSPTGQMIYSSNPIRAAKYGGYSRVVACQYEGMTAIRRFLPCLFSQSFTRLFRRLSAQVVEKRIQFFIFRPLSRTSSCKTANSCSCANR